LVQALYNDSTRTGAMVLLGRMGEPALNDLFQALQSENKQVVLAAQISISDIKKTQSNR
jgi:HEAT repeat protein